MGSSAPPEHQKVQSILDWIKRHPTWVLTAGLALVVGAGAVWFVRTADARRQTFAERSLRQARLTVESGNLPLAANDLSRLAASYGGTPAAGEARLLLARVRLLQGQPALAITELDNFIQGGPAEHFLAPAWGLLGAAYEEAGQLEDAAEAYVQAAGASDYQHLRSQWLLDAGRAFLAGGDTSRAAEQWREILSRYADSPAALEARVRLGELLEPGETPPASS